MAAAVRSNPLPVLLVRVSDRSIIEVSDSLATLWGGSREQLLTHDFSEVIEHPSDAPSSFALLAAGEIDGYRRSHQAYRRLDGTVLAADVWLTGHTDPPRRFAIAIVLPTAASSADVAPPVRGVPQDPWLAVGTVDGEWLIDRISAEVERLLGYAAEAVVGQPVLAGVHPLDVRGLLATIERATSGLSAVSTTVRLRRSSSTWQTCRVVISGLGGQAGLAFGFAVAPAARNAALAGMTHWEDHLRVQVGAAELTASLAAMPSARHLPGLARLTARELEIAARLLAGERVRPIARSLFLSESTVRNHLTGVYRKLGVGSQEELLGTLRAAIRRKSGDFGQQVTRVRAEDRQ